jgi:hypothetical protein
MSRALRFVPDEYKNWTDSYGRDIAVVEIIIRTVLGMFSRAEQGAGSMP